MLKTLKRNRIYFISFFLPVAAMLFIFYLKDIWPFGDMMYLRSDCYHQYAPFLKELHRKLTEGGSLLYSWEIGGGMNFISLIAYYLASPLNILVVFFSEDHITEAVSFFIVLKTGLSSLSFTYYLTKHFNKKNTLIVIFGTFYAMSSYFAAFSWNIMWLDCMVLLPLIILGLEKLVSEGKCLLYCICLGISIFSNYYISIMICIYLVIYFIYLVVVQRKRENRSVIKSCARFGIYSLISGGMAACMIIPEYLTLMTTASGEIDFPDSLENYFSVIYMMSRSLINVDAAIFEAHDPNLYCTVAIFVLVPLYMINRRIDFKERIGKAVLIAVFLFAFAFNIPNYIWHGFHFPNSLPARESFIYIMLLLTIGCEALLRIGQYTTKQIVSCLAGAAALIFVIEELYVGDDYDFSIIYLSLVFIVIYVVLFTLFKSKKASRSFIAYLIIIAAITESAVNMNTTGIGTTSRSAYLEDNEAIETLLEQVEKDDDDLFYRVEKLDRRTKNDAAWNGYYGMSTFSSTSSLALNELYEALGLETSYNAYAFYGHTPLTDAIFSVKYYLSDEYTDGTYYMSLYSFEKVNDYLSTGVTDTSSSSTMYLYQNNFSLSLGFMVDESINDEWDTENANPFIVQNSFVTTNTAAGDIFTNAGTVYISGQTVMIDVDDDGDLYFYLDAELEDEATAYVYDESYDLVDLITYSDMNHIQICHVGDVEAGWHIEVTAGAEDDISSAAAYAYFLDEDNFTAAYNDLAEGELELNTFEDTYVSGTVDAGEGGILCTSISFEDGWKVYVDGQEADVVSIKGALVGVELSEGEHTIEFKYFPDGLACGITISVLSVILLAAISFLKRNGKKFVKAGGKLKINSTGQETLPGDLKE